jgi:hypothetical protein
MNASAARSATSFFVSDTLKATDENFDELRKIAQTRTSEYTFTDPPVDFSTFINNTDGY